MRYTPYDYAVQAIQYGHYGFATEDPLTFLTIPDWLDHALAADQVIPMFLGGPFWHLEVVDYDGYRMLVRPGDWIVYTMSGHVLGMSDQMFRALIEV